MWIRLATVGRRRLLQTGCMALYTKLPTTSFSTAPATTQSQVSPTVSGKTAQKVAGLVLGTLGICALYYGLTDKFSEDKENTVYVNWSHTHEATPWKCLTPENQKEVEKIVNQHHTTDRKLRVVGSGLSPNGIAFTNQTMLDMSLMDKLIQVDGEKKQVRVQCGMRVEQVVEAIRPYGLTLQNYASIKEQQIGGYFQIGAHGTGAGIPPVDEQVVHMKLVTPGMDTIELSKDDPDPTMFYLARVGLGCFGVATEVTLQCIDEHKLVEKSFMSTFAEVKKHHAKWLKENQHLRYMWIPYTNSVVVIQCNPLTSTNRPRSTASAHTPLQQTEAIRDLIATRAKEGKVGSYTLKQLETLSFTELRDVALAEAPLDVDWVKSVNAAEEHYWKRAVGYRVQWSDQILSFDCGGQQWVLEVALPIGTQSKPTTTDLDFMEELFQLIKKYNIPAQTPIEHRWTSGSRSYLSPVYGTQEDLHAWIGIILYLPTDDPQLRQEITSAFGKYAARVEVSLLPKYNGSWHWGKLEIDRLDRTFLNKRLNMKFPLDLMREHRPKFDPNNILGNRITDAIFDAYANDVLPRSRARRP